MPENHPQSAKHSAQVAVAPVASADDSLTPGERAVRLRRYSPNTQTLVCCVGMFRVKQSGLAALDVPFDG